MSYNRAAVLLRPEEEPQQRSPEAEPLWERMFLLSGFRQGSQAAEENFSTKPEQPAAGGRKSLKTNAGGMASIDHLAGS